VASPPCPGPGSEEERLAEGARELGLALDPTAKEAFAVYREELLLWNQRLNLTAIEEPGQVRVKHFLDSLSGALVVDFGAAESLVDVGTGAGFPGLVLKIAFPHLKVVLLDAVEKRLRFLARLVARLGLPDVTTVHARAEEAGREAAWRERFDVVTARAVAPLNVLVEYCLPLARVGGQFLAYKGPETDEEIVRAAAAIRLLGGGAPGARRLVLPGSGMGRGLIAIPKIAPTPAGYPRRTGSARKHPL
jgi:16S rRNA (guanine527-N7)-methyltransferase